jgi:hypothetical protein
MSGPRSPGSPRPVERGEISWVTLVLLLTVAAGGYLGWVWAPAWFQLFTVKQVVRDYMNQAIKNPDDEGLRRNMVAKIRALDEVEARDAYGRPARVPALALDERKVVWARSDGGRGAARTLRVAFPYERRMVYPFVGRTDVRVFHVDLVGELTPPDWGPAR